MAQDVIMEISSDTSLQGGGSIGERLSTMATSQARSRLAAGEEAIQALQARRQSHEKQVKGIDADLLILADSIELREQQVEDQRETVQGMEKLRKEKIVSDVQYRNAKSQYLEQEQALLSMKRERESLVLSRSVAQSTIAEIKAQIRAQKLDLEATAFSEDEKLVGIQREAGSSIRSPVTGKVAFITRSVGDSVSTGETLASVIPAKSDLVATAWVRSSGIGFISPNAEVRLRVAAFPYRRFGTVSGRLVNVTSAPVPVADLPRDLQATEAMYRVMIELDKNSIVYLGQAHALEPGMKFEAHIVMESRTVLEMLMEPMKSRLAGPL